MRSAFGSFGRALVSLAIAASAKAFLDMLGVFAEFETNLRKERQLEGIGQGQRRLQGAQAEH